MTKQCELLVIGGSAGSFEILLKALPRLTFTRSFAIVLVLHRNKEGYSSLAEVFSYNSKVLVKEAEEKEAILPNHIYIAPPDYHLLIEKNKTFSLDYSEKMNYSRPSIDATFQTAAEAYGEKLVCLLLSGSNNDGVEGIKLAKELGGQVAVQNPETCEIGFMPKQAMREVRVDAIVDGDQVVRFIASLLPADNQLQRQKHP